MPITPTQLRSILRVKKEFDLTNGDITLTDLTNWSGSGVINPPDTAAVLLKLIDPTGATVYQNTGYATDNFSSPDFTLTTSVLNETMPVDVNGDYITGTYTLFLKAQVDDNGTIVDSGEVEQTAVVCDCTVEITIDVDVDYATALITTTDTTQYGAYTSLVRSHTIYPPPISGLPSQPTNATTNIYSNIVTTTWSVEIISTVTYLKQSDTYTTCEIRGSKEFLVEADTLCKTLCLLKAFRKDLYNKFGKKCTDEMEQAWNLAMDEYLLAIQATRCGRPQSEIQTYLDKIYELTGLDPNCDCGCSGSEPTPVVPTSIINGTNGTNGVTPQLQNTGTYIQVSYDGGDTWINLIDLATITGAAGANGTNGANGADGVAVLFSNFDVDATTGTALQTWATKTYTLPANTLSNNGDYIEVELRFNTPTSNVYGQDKKFGFAEFGASLVANANFSAQYSNYNLIIKYHRVSNTTVKAELKFIGISLFGILEDGVINFLYTISGLDLVNNSYTFKACGDSYATGDVICNEMVVTLYKFGIGGGGSGSASIQYATPFITSNGVTVYPNVIGQFGKTIKRVYLDGILLAQDNWSYNNNTDILTFNISILGGSTVNIDYI